jgi:hypothetical protein
MGFFLSHANIVTFALLIEDIENYKDLFMFIFETIIYYVNIIVTRANLHMIEKSIIFNYFDK